MDPMVSILIPAFNASPWIADTLRSALAQTWRRREIIAVDDGSSDDTLRIARQFASKEVSVLTQPNQGGQAARNRAYSLCQGDLVQWLDADDLLAPDKIALQVERWRNGDSTRTLLSSEWGKFMHRPHRAAFAPSPLWRDLAPADWLTLKMACNVHMATGSWLISRELSDAAGPWDTTLAVDQDGEYICRVLLKCDGVAFVPGARVFHRTGNFSSVSSIGGSDRKMEALLRSMRFHVSCLLSFEDSPRTRAACLTFLQSGVEAFYVERPDLFAIAQKLALQLGGDLRRPVPSSKYAWLELIGGGVLVRRAQTLMPRAKWSFLKEVDRTLMYMERMMRLASKGNPGE
jgi:glycosyltransferase involved in cell wall biosynthesis